MAIVPGDVLRVGSRITVRKIGGEVFLMDRDRLTTYSLNETAAFVWLLVDGVRTVEEICRIVPASFDIEPEECRGAVTDILSELARECLLVPVGGDDEIRR